jgi:hypothetical protein
VGACVREGGLPGWPGLMGRGRYASSNKGRRTGNCCREPFKWNSRRL